MLPNLEAEPGVRAERRLHDETIVWLTTVRPDGQPQTSPVGFVWDGARFLILSSPGSPKVRNLRSNPKVALHLDLGSGKEEGVLTLEGVATLDPAPAARLGAEETTAYLERHLDAIHEAGLTPEEAFAELSAVIRVTPTRTRFYN